MSKSIRWYSNKLPEKDEIVMATIVSFEKDRGYTVHLNEYGDMEALLIISDLKKGKLRQNPKTFCKIGSKQVLLVKRIEVTMSHDDVEDEDVKIDVSKKDVNPRDMTIFSSYYSLQVKFMGILKRLSHTHNISEQELIENIAWKYDKDIDQDESEHILNKIQHRDQLAELSEIQDKYREMLLESHYKLFGAITVKSHFNLTLIMFGIHGQQDLNDLFESILSKYPTHTNDELYHNPDLYNVEISATAPPQYNVTLTACSRTTCQHAYDTLKELINTGPADVKIMGTLETLGN